MISLFCFFFVLWKFRNYKISFYWIYLKFRKKNKLSLKAITFCVFYIWLGLYHNISFEKEQEKLCCSYNLFVGVNSYYERTVNIFICLILKFWLNLHIQLELRNFLKINILKLELTLNAKCNLFQLELFNVFWWYAKCIK